MRLPVDANVDGFGFPLRRCGCGQMGCIENYLSGRGFAAISALLSSMLQAPEIIALWEQAMRQRTRMLSAIFDLLAGLFCNIRRLSILIYW
ncbi:ROK family protein [Salmonella enterica subsp. enterica]|nr:ROK family protein [Salmonella enterica subsp. enterica]